MQNPQGNADHSENNPKNLDQRRGQIEFIAQANENKRGGKGVADKISDALTAQNPQTEAGIDGDIEQKASNSDVPIK
nr:hypothetical protein [Pelagimonas varians]